MAANPKIMMDKISAIVAESFVVDSTAVYLYPFDGPANHLPVCIQGDGNCLFRAASQLLTGCLFVCLPDGLSACLTVCLPA